MDHIILAVDCLWQSMLFVCLPALCKASPAWCSQPSNMQVLSLGILWCQKILE